MRTDQAKRLKELERENARLKKLVADQALELDPEGSHFGELLSPGKRRVTALLHREGWN